MKSALSGLPIVLEAMYVVHRTLVLQSLDHTLVLLGDLVEFLLPVLEIEAALSRGGSFDGTLVEDSVHLLVENTILPLNLSEPV